MADAGIRVEGLGELKRNLRVVDKELPKGLTKIHKAVAGPVADHARTLVRSKSGKLANSIRPLGSQRAARVSAGARLAYGAVNHWGGYPGDYAGNPFLTDAINSMEGRTIADYDRLLGEWLDSVWQDTF